MKWNIWLLTALPVSMAPTWGVAPRNRLSPVAPLNFTCRALAPDVSMCRPEVGSLELPKFPPT